MTKQEYMVVDMLEDIFIRTMNGSVKRNLNVNTGIDKEVYKVAKDLVNNIDSIDAKMLLESTRYISDTVKYNMLMEYRKTLRKYVDNYDSNDQNSTPLIVHMIERFNKDVLEIYESCISSWAADFRKRFVYIADLQK